ncbi:MAG: hypothetical protein J6B60_04495 [Clostridia bacterium]|nr:hypothetical protein [Clostridia bacterium]
MGKRKKKIIIISSIATALIAIIVACGIYLGTYYHADEEAVSAFLQIGTVVPENIDDNITVFKPQNARAGFIFYPGGKVEHEAYYPLMQKCAEQGILCVIVEMPFRLAVFDINAAEGISNMYPDIERWYIGGHSLGGSMAASYLADHKDEYQGLILLGSYSTEDFSNSDIDVLSIYGSEDKVLNEEKYDENKSNLPSDFTEYIINGGCHAYFGMYGHQKGDGTPSITNTEQIFITAEKISEFIS